MRTPTVALQDAASPFELEEMFFSTTDRKGVITSGNRVFVRVSGFTAAELIGSPHNIIRHPDMPRAVFRLLWRTIGAGRPIVAYVKNLAKDGRYYWVVAFIMPVDGGYLSIRFKPSAPLLAQVEALYARMRAIEREQGDAGEGGRAGMDAAERMLGEQLRALGFAHYGTFMWTLMQAEMKSRDAALHGRSRALAVQPTGSTCPATLAGCLRAIHATGEHACGQIDRLYRRLDELAHFSTELVSKAAFVTDLTREIRFVALSTSLESTRLGEAGNSLGVIANFLSRTSTQTAGDVGRLTTRIREITAELQQIAFQLSGARLQIEMVLIFCRELLQGSSAAAGDERAGPARMIAVLRRAFGTTSAEALALLRSLSTHLDELGNGADDLRKTMLTLQVAQIAGQVETSRLQDHGAVSQIFGEVRTHVANTSAQLSGLADITAALTRLVHATPEIEREVGSSVARMEAQVVELETAGAS